jgi:hypothetical protein
MNLELVPGQRFGLRIEQVNISQPAINPAPRAQCPVARQAIRNLEQ